MLHFLRGGEAQDLDALFQNVFGQSDQCNVTGLPVFVLFLQNGCFVIELVDAAGQLVDIGADQVGGRCLQRAFQSGAELGDGEHQILGIGIGRSLDSQVLPRTILCQDGLDPDDGIENIRTGVALESGENYSLIIPK